MHAMLFFYATPARMRFLPCHFQAMILAKSMSKERISKQENGVAVKTRLLGTFSIFQQSESLLKVFALTGTGMNNHESVQVKLVKSKSQGLLRQFFSSAKRAFMIDLFFFFLIRIHN
ncbi:hypothetical protein RHGRI_032458 [Rhododendron griersonianum]|uniref:Uncharacterized protein n=1 Tax=Rhododendron griersonianum TaxID=479676 RepID=A0AAV6IF34_9ERIC|nr:hypothetical protein RHGRI_032458 [Rhododendron griersonianum]